MKKDKLCGIYSFTNLVNNKKYIGCSNNIYKRWIEHEKTSADINEKRIFYKALRKYGLDNFEKAILELCKEDELKIREDFYIDLFNSTDRKFGYNIEKGYNTIEFNPNKEQIINKLSNKAKNRVWINNNIKNFTIDKNELINYLNEGWKLGRLAFSNEHKIALSKSHTGVPLSEMQKINLSKAIKGRKLSNTAIQNIKNGSIGKHSLAWYVDKYGVELGTKKHEDKFKIKPTKGKICVNNTIISKFINPNELDAYISDGWVKGKLKYNKTSYNSGKICINNKHIEKFVYLEEIEEYLLKGWVKGKLKKYKTKNNS